MRPISRRYWRNRSEVGPPASGRPGGPGASTGSSSTGSGTPAVSGWREARSWAGTAGTCSVVGTVRVCTGATSR